MAGHALLSQIDALLSGHTQQSEEADPGPMASPWSSPPSAANAEGAVLPARWTDGAGCTCVRVGWYILPRRGSLLPTVGDGEKTSLGDGRGGDIGSVAP